MRFALDPAALAWALHPRGSAARAALLQHDAFVPTGALERLRALRPALEEATGLARGELWDLLQLLLSRVRAVPADEYDEFLSLARRLAPACAPAMAVALALEVDAVLAGAPGLEAQRLVPVVRAWPAPRQAGLPEGRADEGLRKEGG